MPHQRFWVIGGEFRSIDFDELNRGTEQLFGPYASREQAETTWRDISRRYGHECRVRFTIVQEPLRATA